MRTARSTQPRTALVLGGGGITGGLYEVGACLGLDTVLENLRPCDFDLYVGTSAGAFVAALLANRVTPQQLRDTLVKDRRTLPHLTGSQFLSLPWRHYLTAMTRLGAAVPRLAFDLWWNWRDALVLDTLGSLVRYLPHGVLALDGIESYVRAVLTRGDRTNDFRRLQRPLLVPATALDTGAIHVFGERRGEHTPISKAVAASAAIPLLFAPVEIDGVDYVDAAVTKSAHAGLALDRGAGLVVVVNPVRPLVLDHPSLGRVRDGGATAIAGQSLRIALQRRLHDGMRRHAYEHPEADLVLLEPYHHDLQLFDVPLMTHNLRLEVIRRGYRTTIKTVLGDYERYVALFARHGITLTARDEIERRARRWSSAARRAA